MINTNKETIYIDLINSVLKIDDKIEKYEIRRNDTYMEQHKALLAGQYDRFCSYKEGQEVLKLIEAIEKANIKSSWVKL